MTLWKVHRLQAPLPGGNRLPKNEMHRFVLRSNLLWFSIVFVANTTCFVVQLAVNDPVLSHLPTPIGIVGTAIVAARIVFDPSRLKPPQAVPNIFADDYLSSMEASSKQACASASASPFATAPARPHARPSNTLPTSFSRSIEEEQERKEAAAAINWSRSRSPTQYVETLRGADRWCEDNGQHHRLGQMHADSISIERRQGSTPAFEITPSTRLPSLPPSLYKADF
ncbi:hypothetical protein CBOM_02558 [Ceraceosorus bombacis]|uniref:Uncharacterized protein n=1 Tax=Ceraceosorus bombacis TaxID=401625 RepID=A0A0P1BEV4_9BASI|nr:hypothetical protein CBOM_02558 [Ceraceosorus bombacis]